MFEFFFPSLWPKAKRRQPSQVKEKSDTMNAPLSSETLVGVPFALLCFSFDFKLIPLTHFNAATFSGFYSSLISWEQCTLLTLKIKKKNSFCNGDVESLCSEISVPPCSNITASMSKKGLDLITFRLCLIHTCMSFLIVVCI